METLIPEISRLLNDSLSPDKTTNSSATDGLDQLSRLPQFPFSLLAIATGGDNQGLRIAAATYLKNFTRCHLEDKPSSPKLHIEFRNQLAQALLQVEPAVLKVLVEAFRRIIVEDFVKKNSWPDLVPELKSVIQTSTLISQSACSQWSTINALTVLQTIVKPFQLEMFQLFANQSAIRFDVFVRLMVTDCMMIGPQYFLNPKVPKEPVPSQLELVAKEILVPLQATFHHFIDKALSFQDEMQVEYEQILLIICKCMYFTMRSYMPSALRLLLPSFCGNLLRILDSLSLHGTPLNDGYLIRLKTAKRSLIILCALVTRHRKHADRLLPSIINCTIRLTKKSPDISMLDSLSERIISLAFDVISHVLETGPGWRLVSPHFSSLLDSAILPALALNQKDIAEWKEDNDEYMRKNLPSELDEISGWAEDLFTARKSAINLLGVIAMSKGPPVTSAPTKRKKGDKHRGKERQSSIGELLVVPFLSKFPMPSNGEDVSSKKLQDYFGVLMAYGGLQDFLKERNLDHTSTLVRKRVLPLYSFCACSPFLVATANWVLGELASCLPESMNADIYSSLMKALTMPDDGDFGCYPVHASAAGAIAELLENDYAPPDWLSLLQVLVSRIDLGDENESSLLFQLLGTVVEAGKEEVAVHIPVIVSNIAGIIANKLPSIAEPWPQVVERGFATLSEMAQTWEDSTTDDAHQCENTEWEFGRASMARVVSSLLRQARLMPLEPAAAVSSTSLPPSCVQYASHLLGFVMRAITTADEVVELKLAELLAVWANLIADWHSWEEMEDLAIFNSIQDAVNLHRRCDFANFFIREMPSHNLSVGSSYSIIEGISTFVCEGITAYPSAMRRACLCTHALLHVPRFSFEMEAINQSMAVAFTKAAFSRSREIHDKPLGLHKPLVLVISSCYISYPENIEQLLEKVEDKGFTIWARALANVSINSSEPVLSSESEIKLAGITLAKVVERLLEFPLDRGNEVLRHCFVALLEACIRLKEVQGAELDDEASDERIDDDDGDDEEETDYSEDSEDDEHEETEEEFLERYAKAAAELEDEVVVEGDLEDEEQELDLGAFDEFHVQKTLLSLMRRHQLALIQGQAFSTSLIQGISNTFPELSFFFHSI